jgi:hypothetical protein
MFRLRKEKHTSDLEAKVEELEALLNVASHENSVATARMNKMELDLCHYRGLLFAATNQKNTFISSYPSSAYRPGGNWFEVGEETSTYANMPYCYLPVSRGSLTAPVIGDEYHRVRSYGSCSTGTYSPAKNSPSSSSRSLNNLQVSPQERNVDNPLWEYYSQHNVDLQNMEHCSICLN